MEKYQKIYSKWVNNSTLDPELKRELLRIKDNEKEIAERFYKNLEFGTAGLRGIIGAGTNRMNIYTIRKASQGLANFINKQIDSENKIVVIAYDSRYKSKEFALESALVLAQNNIKTYIFKEITPIPVLSFAIGKLKAISGIVITASHNPKEYNGYKVYWKHGGQVIDDLAEGITQEINAIEDELSVSTLDSKEAESKGLLNWIGDEILDTYINKTKELVLNNEVITEIGDEFRIVYTPLHGTGYKPVTKLLKEAGFANVNVVKEQAKKDPQFSTVKSPNPEDPQAFNLALNLAQEIDADIIMATDPDADRIGVMVKDPKGGYVLLTGNQLGALLINYILKMRDLKGILPKNGVIIKTIVTSQMGAVIAQKYGVDYLDVLTGFKYIGEKIEQFSQEKNYTFLFGYEESYGFLACDYIRDKDAVQIALLTAEMAAYYKKQGLTLIEQLDNLFKEFGFFKEELINIKLTGIEGQQKINNILKEFRQNPPQNIKGLKVSIIKDYLVGKEINLNTGEEKPINLPISNVLHYTLEDNSWFCIRPSGTEPKLKIYFGVIAESNQEAENKLKKIKNEVLLRIEN